MLNKVGREYHLDFQANINLNLWFNFKKFQWGMETLMRNLNYSSYVEVQLEI